MTPHTPSCESQGHQEAGKGSCRPRMSSYIYSFFQPPNRYQAIGATLHVRGPSVKHNDPGHCPHGRKTCGEQIIIQVQTQLCLR